ncbi:MAG: hypothetical protein WKF83_15100 [Nocardioidaceae bacterium]
MLAPLVMRRQSAVIATRVGVTAVAVVGLSACASLRPGPEAAVEAARTAHLAQGTTQASDACAQLAPLAVVELEVQQRCRASRRSSRARRGSPESKPVGAPHHSTGVEG